MSTQEITLDNLFREAVTAMKREAAKPKRVEEKVPGPTPQALWANPDNWKHNRFVTLIHETTKDVLGIYEELVHVKHPTSRRLVAAPDAKPEAVEYVRGAWAIQPALPETCHKHSLHEVCLDLRKLGVAAIRCKVDLHLAYDELVEVTLLESTTFASADKELIIQLPSHSNVLPVLGQNCKAELTELVRNSHD